VQRVPSIHEVIFSNPPGPYFQAANAKRPAHFLSTRAAGGTVGIDQEVVTLRGLFGNSGSQHDLLLGGSQP